MLLARIQIIFYLCNDKSLQLKKKSDHESLKIELEYKFNQLACLGSRYPRESVKMQFSKLNVLIVF